MCYFGLFFFLPKHGLIRVGSRPSFFFWHNFIYFTCCATLPSCLISIRRTKTHFMIFGQHLLLNQRAVLFPGNYIRADYYPVGSKRRINRAAVASLWPSVECVQAGALAGGVLRSGGAVPSHCGDRRPPAGELAALPCWSEVWVEGERRRRSRRGRLFMMVLCLDEGIRKKGEKLSRRKR